MVTLKIPAKVMSYNGWVDNGKPQFSRETVNEAIVKAQKTYRKRGNGGQFTLVCNPEDAEFIIEQVLTLGQAWFSDADKQTKMDGRFLLNSVDGLMEQFVLQTEKEVVG